MKRFLALLVLIVVAGGTAAAQAPPNGDVLGSHYLGPGSISPIQGGTSSACMYCHAPHSGVGVNGAPLWSQTLSTQNYTLYTSTTLQNTSVQPVIGSPSNLCLSCHDGTVSVGSKVPYGDLTMTGTMYSKDVFGANLGSSHPLSLKTPLTDSAVLVTSLASTHQTADPDHKVKLVNGTVECNSCHEPHQQNIDPASLNFLIRDSVNGQLCLACHANYARTVNGKDNPLALWTSSAHAVSGNNVNAGANLGSYATVAQFACLSCHRPHNANGTANILRPPSAGEGAGLDPATRTCMNCHNGGTNLQVPIANVYAEFAKKGHPFPAGANTHDAKEPAVLVNNRHATCVDCHNSHGSFPVSTFGAAPAIRVSQSGVVGVSANDGTTVINPAANQFENCLRCHGTSPGKQALDMYGYLPLRAVSAADRLDVIAQLSATASSSHDVLHPRSSPLLQPSLRNFMLKLDGTTDSTRVLAGAGDRLHCTDCHNSDENREFGGTGPNGPHGSQYLHILERRYEFSQVAIGPGPGSLITNLFPNPDLGAGGATPGPYAMCGKCHDLNNVVSDASFLPGTTGRGGHLTHVKEDGFSCSVCHTGHGIGSVSPTISGERLVNFDANVVGTNGGPVSYYRATNTCTLTCHNALHNSDGTVTIIP